MADISVRMSVSGLSQYKKDMREAKEAVKSLDAQLKLNEEQLKLNGNAELYMSNKAALLKKQIEEQTKVVSAAEEALKKMKESGEDSGTAFHKMQTEVYNAAAKLTSMKTELQQVESGAAGAKKETSEMNSEMRNVGKGIAWQNVTEGLHKITESMQNGARAAVNLGKQIARSAMDSTAWADDVLTRASKNGVDAETIQRMDNVAEYIDTDVDTIIAAQTRLAKNKESLGELLGLDVNGKSVDEAFWEAGKAISAMNDEWEREEAAQKIFGRGWKELIPLFEAGQEKYNQLMAEQTVLSNENVQKLAAADDAIKSIQQQVELMKNQFWSENADKIISLMEWILNNKDGIVAALTAIGAAFGAIKIGEFATDLGKTISGFQQLQSLFGNGSDDAAAAAAASSGTGSAAASGTAASGGVFSKILNNVTLIAAADAMYQATEGQLRAVTNDFNTRTSGMTAAERSKQALIENFNMTDSDYAALSQKMNKGSGGGVSFDAIPVVEDGAAALLSMEIGVVPVAAELVFHRHRMTGEWLGLSPDGSNANGLPFVPFDGYISVLHKGERVLTAREANQYNSSFSSNLYVENMNMHNGQNVDSLAEAIAARNRRIMRGFGN